MLCFSSLLFLFFLGFLPFHAAHVLYVTPTKDTLCPGTPCHTLDEYTHWTQHNNTIMKFVIGMHHMNHNFEVIGVHDLTLAAIDNTPNETVLHCDSTYFHFVNLSKVTIKGITLVNCGNGSQHPSGSLVFHCVRTLTLSRVIIQEPIQYGIVANDVFGNSSIEYIQVRGSLEKSVGVMITNWSLIHCPCPHSNSSHSLVIRESTFNYVSQTKCDKCNDADAAIGFEIYQACDIEYNITIENVIFLNATNLVFSLFSHEHNITPPSFTIRNVTFPNITYDIGSYNIDSFPDFSAIVLIHKMQNAIRFINCSFYGNNANTLSIFPNIVYTQATVLLWESHNVSFTNCSFRDNIGSAIFAFYTDITVSGTLHFQNNTAYYGGALVFLGDGNVYISNNTNITFHNNTAIEKGGAIYVSRYPLGPKGCFFQHARKHTPLQLLHVTIKFINNTAQKGGNGMYGVFLYLCWKGKEIEHFFHRNSTFRIRFEPTLNSSFSQISSEPTRACLCEHGIPNCTIVFKNRTHAYPGETISIPAVIVGDIFGTVDGSVYAQFLPRNGHINATTLEDLQTSQQVSHSNCTKLKYTVFSEAPGVAVMILTSSEITIERYPNKNEIEEIRKEIESYIPAGKSNNGSALQSFPVFINITLLPCPPGFMLTGHQCGCMTLLQHSDITCNITGQTIHRRSTVWVAASTDGEVKVSTSCPFDYCNADRIAVSLKHPDTQCAFNHSGILCGACQPGLSLALGSPQCLPCSNSHLSLLLAFAAAGIVVVFFIKILDLTVANGAINGLIFYANIVRATQYVFFPAGDTNPLTVFIAWLNLDLGIETCFFDGLDSYWKTWLQFVFPFYILGIIILIIILSDRYPFAARIFGNNSVPVLATLILLSYTKLLRTVFISLSFTVVEVSNAKPMAVWSFDGNIQYLSWPKHIPLFLAAVSTLLFLWLPFTVLLLFGQCFQRIETDRFRKWMLRLKPFLDAYSGPMKDKHRYWIGILLLARVILLLVFSLNSTNDHSVNLLALSTVAVLLLMSANNLPSGNSYRSRRIGSCYKKWYLSLLETSFFFNLVILAAATSYVSLSGGNQRIVAYTSVSIAFCQFIGMALIRGYNIIKKLGQKWNQAGFDSTGEQYSEREWSPPQGRDQYQDMDQLREPLLEYEDY